MLSITPIKCASQASSYYEADNYYAKDSAEATQASHWWGTGAVKLGLKGFVTKNDFQSLLEGKLPSGQQLGRFNEGEVKHRPGYDLTFSAPKSVSILAEVGKDERLTSAHDKAVNAALSYLQEHAAQTRRSEQGAIQFDKTDNLLVAKFRHDTSREQDPQTHTHCVILNATQRQDGLWRSISSEKLYDYKMAAGSIYRATLAYEIKKLGYTLDKTHADGRFEISSVPKEVIKEFSKRRQQIEQAMVERGLLGDKAAEKTTLLTRTRKIEMDRDMLHQHWTARLQEKGYAISQTINDAKEKAAAYQKPNSVQQALESVKYAIQHLSEREARFSHDQLLRVALGYGVGDMLPKHVEQAIQRLQAAGFLISTTLDNRGILMWTTKEAIEQEKASIQLMRQGRNSLNAIGKVENVNAYLSHQRLTPGQQKAAKLILTSRDKVVGIQGYAGTGKTTLLETVRVFAEMQGFTLKGLAPSATAAQQLEKSAGVQSQTLHRYLQEQEKFLSESKSHPKNAASQKEVLIVDEASMVSNNQMHKLLKLTQLTNTKLVLVGDAKQLGAVEAGKPFTLLQKAGMKTAVMQQILRQKNPELLAAVQLSIQGQIKQALQKISENVHEITHKEERLLRMVKDYLALSTDKRLRTLVLTPANEDRQMVNQLIREGLKHEGQLKGEEGSYAILINKSYTKAEKTRVENYIVGDVVRFNKTYPNLQIKAGDYCKVVEGRRPGNDVTLQRSDGGLLNWDPQKIGGRREGAIEVYQAETRGLMVGDKIVWTRNQKEEGLLNAEMLTVSKIKGSRVDVINREGIIQKLDLQNPNHQHWDHAYATTVHSAQGKTEDIVLAHSESFRQNLTHQQSFYVSISRARHEAHIYTDDKEQYLATLNRFTGEKTSALQFDATNTINTTTTKNNKSESAISLAEKVGSKDIEVDI